MPLTNPLWKGSFRLQAATAGGNPLKQGETGAHVDLLRQALEWAGFERTLEPMDFYGLYTAAMVADFREIYGISGDAGTRKVADKAMLEMLDSVLNGTKAKKKFKTGALAATGASGKAFAVKYLATTKSWVEDALKACRTASASLSALKGGGAEHAVADTVYLPFLMHFRIAVCLPAAKELLNNKYNKSLFLFYSNFADITGDSAVVHKEAVASMLTHISKIERVFKQLQEFLGKPVGDIFEDDATTPHIAHTPDKIIFFSTVNFQEISTSTPNGQDPKTASWVPIHEAGHAVMSNASHHSGTGAGDNPYSYRPSYYQMNFAHALTNPDSFAHFAYQCAAKKPNIGPWV